MTSDEREYMNQILNILPIGISTYDDELKLTFYNEKGKNLLESNSKEDRKMENIIEKFCGSRKTDKNLIRMAFENSNSIRNKIITLNSGDKKNVKLVVDVLKLDGRGYLCLYSEAKKEQELENLRLQTQTILDCLSNTVMIFDKTNKIIMCNLAFEKIFEMKIQEVQEMKKEEFEKLVSFNYKSYAGSSEQNNGMDEVTITTKNGNDKDLLIQPANIYNVDGEVMDISVGTDITDLKRSKLKYYIRIN